MKKLVRILSAALVLIAMVAVFGGGVQTARADDGGHSHGRYLHLTWVPRHDLSATTVEFTLRAAFRHTGYLNRCRAAGSSFTFVACTGPVFSGSLILPGPGDIIREDIGGTDLNFGDMSSTGTLWFEVTSINVAENWLFAVALQPGSSSPNIIHAYPSTPSSFLALSGGDLGLG